MNERVRVKICGVRDARTALVCAEAGADAVGLVFAEGSVRRVDEETAATIVRALPPFVTPVGLFVDAPVEMIARAHERVGFGAVQVQGGETPETCAAIARATGMRVIKGIRFDEATIDEELARWSEAEGVSALLVDGSSGGHGRAFDWDALARRLDVGETSLILAGGLSSDNVRDALARIRVYGVDVSSGVELDRGVKDADRIRSFIRAVREIQEPYSGDT